MKRVTASEARRSWFRLLDEVAAGAVVVIERHGKRILLRREEEREGAYSGLPDYSSLLEVREPDRAAEWGWEWGPEGGLEPSDAAADRSAGGEPDDGE